VTVSDDIRAAKKHRQFHSARDFETSASQIGDLAPFAEDVKAKAQRIIAANAEGHGTAAQAADAAQLMRMLGVHPDDTWDPALGMDLPLPGPQNNSSRGRS
jgi:hypothetical protein